MAVRGRKLARMTMHDLRTDSLRPQRRSGCAFFTLGRGCAGRMAGQAFDADSISIEGLPRGLADVAGWQSSSSRRLLVGAAFADAARALEDRLQRIHHEAD